MSLLTGPSAALRALGVMFKHPSLFALAAIPAVVTLLLSAFAVWLAVSHGADALTWLWPEPDGGIAGFFWSVIAWVLRLGSAALSVFITPWLVMLVGFPLCEPLAVKVDTLLGGRPVAGTFKAEMVKALTATLGITAIGLAGSVVFFVLGLIPGVALFTTPFVAFVWTPLFLAFDLFDGSLSRRQLGFRQKLRFVTGRFVTALSVGLVGTALIAVPVLNLVGLPVAVVMAVIVVREREKAGPLVPTN